jgi:hypothetical protein
VTGKARENTTTTGQIPFCAWCIFFIQSFLS